MAARRNKVRTQTSLLPFAVRLVLRLTAVGGCVPIIFSSKAQDDSVSILRDRIDQAERERVEICKILGAIYEEIGDAEKAIENYRMAFQVFPDDPSLCDKLIRLYKDRESWASLMPVYVSLINANPGANQTYMADLAECHLKVGQVEQAVRVFSELLDEYGDDADAYRDVAQKLMSHNQYDAAARICRKGIEGKFGESCDLHWVLGRALGKQEKYSEAVAVYERAISLCTSERNRRMIEEELAGLCKEEPIIEQVLQQRIQSLNVVDERLTELYWQKAVIEESKGNLSAAVSLYRKVASLAPGSERAKAAELKVAELGVR